MDISICITLFGKSAETLFPKTENAEKSLQLIHETAQKLFQRNRQIFDPAAHNNQCHLYSLFLADPKRNGKEGVRFVTLCFMRSYYSVARPSAMAMFLPEKSRKFFKSADTMRKLALSSLIDSFRTILIHRLRQAPKDALSKELVQIATEEDLSHQLKYGAGRVYTYPKFAGVCFLLKEIKRAKIPFAVHVKIVSQMGQGRISLVYPTSNAKPVMALEGLLAGEGYSAERYIQESRACPRNIRRKSAKPKPNHSCTLCGPSISVEPFRELLAGAFNDLATTMMQFGADFVRKKQPSFVAVIAKYPKLDQLFEAHQRPLEQFTVLHMHPGGDYQLDTPPEEYLGGLK